MDSDCSFTAEFTCEEIFFGIFMQELEAYENDEYEDEDENNREDRATVLGVLTAVLKIAAIVLSLKYRATLSLVINVCHSYTSPLHLICRRW